MELEHLQKKAEQITLLITDCDGVLTDGGVYYGVNGEELKRFNMRDGMGVERLRKMAKVKTAIMTGEESPSVQARAKKLRISDLHLGVKNKSLALSEIITQRGISLNEIAYIGDDLNDFEVLRAVGFSACPADAMPAIRRVVDYVCQEKGGHGAFREFAEFIIEGITGQNQKNYEYNRSSQFQ